MAQFPTVTYSNVKHKVDNGLSSGTVAYKDESITVAFNTGTGTAYKASYKSPFNQVTGNYTPNRALSRFEIRVNPAEDSNHGPGIGHLAFSDTGIANGTTKAFTINITTTIFTGSSSNTYRVCLLAQSELDHSWDSTELFLVVGPGEAFVPKNSGGGYEVHHDTII